MLTETLSLLEECKRESSAECEAESARMRNEGAALVAKMKSHWYQKGRERLVEFAVSVGSRIKILRAFMQWRVNAEQGRRVMLGKKFAGALSDAGGELVKSPAALLAKPQQQRVGNPFGALALDDEEDDALSRAAKLEDEYAATLRLTAKLKEEATGKRNLT